MAINTQTMNGELVKEAGAPEGYEFKADPKGRIALKKIRKSLGKAIKETGEVVEAIADVAKEIVKAVKPKRGKK